MPPFRQRWPWIGPDLQTLRDTLRPPRLGPDRGEPLEVVVGGAAPGEDPPACGERLLVLRDPPLAPCPRGLVVLVHG
ncbi:MAG: alpha/beta hydrolase, partial [Prochlorococcaceae cyanobacterium]